MEAFNLLLFVLFVGTVLWTVLSRGKRLAAAALRGLAAQYGGRYRSGGPLQGSSLLLFRGGQALQLQIHSGNLMGSNFVASFQAPWLPPRPALGMATPSQLRFIQPTASLAQATDQLADTESTHSYGLGLDVRETGRLLESFVVVDSITVWTHRNQFHAQAVLNSLAPPQLAHWFELMDKFYHLLAAETEAGIQFGAIQHEEPVVATCQVCGLPPATHDSVHCRTCGAPHHRDCWDYNGGCAIYGCREKDTR